MIKRVAKDSSLVVIDEAGVGAGGGVDTDRTVSKSTMFSYIAGIVLEFAVFVLESRGLACQVYNICLVWLYYAPHPNSSRWLTATKHVLLKKNLFQDQN